MADFSASWTIEDDIFHALDSVDAVPGFTRPQFPPEDDWERTGPDSSTPVHSTRDYRLDEPEEEVLIELDPWEQIAGETDHQFSMFSHFLNSGYGRSRRATAREFEVSSKRVDGLARDNQWERRARAWDLERERVYAGTKIDRVREMADRHAAVMQRGIEAMAIAFYPLVARAAADPDAFAAEVAELPLKTQFAIATQAARVIPAMMSAERLAHDMPTEIMAVQQDIGIDITMQSRGDLAEIVGALAGIGNLNIIDASVASDKPGDHSLPPGDDDRRGSSRAQTEADAENE